MGFIIGVLIGIAAGAYMGHRYSSTIQDWLDMRD